MSLNASPLFISFCDRGAEEWDQRNKKQTGTANKRKPLTIAFFSWDLMLLSLLLHCGSSMRLDPPGTSLGFVACLQMKKCYWGSRELLLCGQIHFPAALVGWREGSRQEVTSLSPLWSSKAPEAIRWFMLPPGSWCLCFLCREANEHEEKSEKWRVTCEAMLLSVSLAFSEGLTIYCRNTPASKANGRCRSEPSTR